MESIIEVSPRRFVRGGFTPTGPMKVRDFPNTRAVYRRIIPPLKSVKAIQMWIDPHNGDTWLSLADGGWVAFIYRDRIFGRLEPIYE